MRDRTEFARRYERVIRAYMESRWNHSPLHAEIDDAVQEVFLACFSAHGPLERAAPDRGGGFRAYLYGVVRNVARGFERKWRQRTDRVATSFDLDRLEGRDEPLSQVFDRAWAVALLKEAAARQSEIARGSDEAASRRVELLSLRFQENLTIREIAQRWKAEPDVLHHEYRRARLEFLAALREVVRDHHGGTPAEVEAECVRLLEQLRKI